MTAGAGSSGRQEGKVRVIVIGAGVIGLTTAYLLSQEQDAATARYEITVAAKHMPGDYDIEYASPWAGANYLPVSEQGTRLQQYEAETWPPLQQLASQNPEAGIHFQKCLRYVRAHSTDVSAESKNIRTAGKFKGEAWYKHVMPDYRPLTPDELPPGFASGSTFTTVVINSPLYLSWLVSQCLKNGVRFTRAVFDHIAEAQRFADADIVLNCTGLSANKLGGVQDSTIHPARGQVVVVRNEINVCCDVLGLELGDGEVCYAMQRAAGGGTILGGSYQLHNWDANVDYNLATRIMQRAIAACPSLLTSPNTTHAQPPESDSGNKTRGVELLDIIRHGVGLRPVRRDGIRIEKELYSHTPTQPDAKTHLSTSPSLRFWIVHNYGHGSYGYQSSYGCASAAIKLVREITTQEGMSVR